jgi:hypothetical protein
MNLVYGCDEIVANFVAQFISGCNERGFQEPYRAIGVVKDDQLIGGFVYHNWAPEAGVIEFSGASSSKRWLSRKVLFGLFAYPFLGIGCQMVCARVSVRNGDLIRMLKAYGFCAYHIPRLFGRNETGVVLTLTIEDWQKNGFHKDTYNGKTVTPEAA